jgi:hypothetical protein
MTKGHYNITDRTRNPPRTYSIPYDSEAPEGSNLHEAWKDFQTRKRRNR